MFNLQGSEIIIVMLLALVVLGPEKLPDAMRKAGKAYAELKKMSTGFQSEFRAAVEEPLREIRETANVLRDSADFTKLQDGDRDEKPKSAEMAPVDPDASPAADIPTFETAGDDGADGPDLAAESRSAPFSGESSSSPMPTPPPPFTGMKEEVVDITDADPVAGVPETVDVAEGVVGEGVVGEGVVGEGVVGEGDEVVEAAEIEPATSLPAEQPAADSAADGAAAGDPAGSDPDPEVDTTR